MIYLASDHTGFEMKVDIAKYLLSRGYKVEDFGPGKSETVDYPEYALKVARKAASDPNARGILVSNTGQGMCIAANKVKGAYAAIVFNEQLAEKARQVNNSNVLCLPSSYIDLELAEDIVSIWLSTSFSGVDHHIRCLKQIREIE